MPGVARVATLAVPFLMKQLPKLWPLLLDPKNRDLVRKYAIDLSSKAPGRKLAAKIDLTSDLAQSMAERATTPAEAHRAQAWQKRAAAMRDRLALPVVADKRKHRADLEADLRALHDEMSEVLRQGESSSPTSAPVDAVYPQDRLPD